MTMVGWGLGGTGGGRKGGVLKYKTNVGGQVKCSVEKKELETISPIVVPLSRSVNVLLVKCRVQRHDSKLTACKRIVEKKEFYTAYHSKIWNTEILLYFYLQVKGIFHSTPPREYTD